MEQLAEHVLISGGAMGIGATVATQALARGAVVSVVDRETPENCTWWTDAPDQNRGAWITCDLADPQALASAAEGVRTLPLTGFVAAAGISAQEDFAEFDADLWRRTLEINVTATATLISAVSAAMQNCGAGGSVVTLSSTAAFGHVRGLGVAYHASKGAVLAMTKALAGELAPAGIRVNTVSPGVVSTPMTAAVRAAIGEEVLAARTMLGRIATTDDVADVVSYLLSPASSFVTGTAVPVEGGQLAIAAR